MLFSFFQSFPPKEQVSELRKGGVYCDLGEYYNFEVGCMVLIVSDVS